MRIDHEAEAARAAAERAEQGLPPELDESTLARIASIFRAAEPDPEPTPKRRRSRAA